MLIVEIALHDVKPSDHDFAGFVGRCKGSILPHDANLDLGNRAPRCFCNDVGRIAWSAHCDQAAGLGETVGGDDGVDAEGLSHCDNQLGWYRRCTCRRFFKR